MKCFRLIIAGICAVAIFYASGIRAFSISPLKYHLTVAPGTSNQIISLTVHNDESVAQDFFLKVISAVQEEGGRLIYASGENQAEGWVEPEAPKITIPANSEQAVIFRINVPLTAQAGSYYLGLAAEKKAGTGVNVGLSGQLIAPLLLQVAGIVNESLSVASWKQPPVIFWKRNWSYSWGIKNNGNVELPVKATVVVRDWRDKDVFRQETKPDEVLLPGSGRAFGSEVKLPYGDFYLPGPYTADLIIDYGRTAQSVSASRTIWLFPPGTVIILAIALAIAAYAVIKKKMHD